MGSSEFDQNRMSQCDTLATCPDMKDVTSSTINMMDFYNLKVLEDLEEI